MAIQIDERFVVGAPAKPVWEFLVDPRRVVTCVPGGELTCILDERTYRGKVRVKFGPLTLAYGGRVRLAEVDVPARRVLIVGEAHETAGADRARLTLESWLTPLPGGSTEVIAVARVEVEGHIVELGRGFLEQLGHVVFQAFAGAVRVRIEAEQARRAAAVAGADVLSEPAQSAPPLRVIPVVFQAVRAWARGRRPPHGEETPRSAIGGRPA